MEVIQTGIKDLVEIHPKIFGDGRGWFLETFNQDKYHLALPPRTLFVQDNLSYSNKGVLRGLHFQEPPFAQAKLVFVIQGRVLDIAVDLRRSSETYGKVFSVILDAKSKNQLFVPRGFAHGFSCLEDETIFSYKCDNLYSKEHERTLQWNDAELGIDWMLETPILSEKDRTGESFESFNTPFD
jgi:dTDP-4-dehydrorhamnose 3,5-epimerase